MHAVGELRSRSDILFDCINYALMTVFALLVLYPLYFIVIASVSDPNSVYAGKVWLLPNSVSFEGYARIFKDQDILIGYRNSIFYTVMGTLINLFVTLTAAYALSKKHLPGRALFMGLFVFTMYFDGGLIPTYLLISKLGWLDTVWAILVPRALTVWNLIIARTFFEQSVPEELVEAATIDGCSQTRSFLWVVLPLSNALIAVMSLFYAVGHWNMWFEALIFLTNQKLYPLQLVLRNILIQAQPSSDMMTDVGTYAEKARVTDQIKYGVIIVASVPVLVLYPFLQRYFVKGVMIGALKG